MERGMNDAQHEEIQEMLGAYALNATDALERRRVERHLSSCDDCANEVRLLKETTSELAWLAQTEDATDLTERISENLPARGRTIRLRIASGVAAVAVAVAGVLGASLVHQRSVNSQLSDVLAQTSRRVSLSAQGGFEGRGVLHIGSGKAALVLDQVPEPGKDRTYQLWAISGTKPRSMVVVDGADRVVRLFDWEGRADTFAVTIEPEGGSPVPTSDPVLLGA
jgi:anti-sigma-K factor RskA